MSTFNGFDIAERWFIQCGKKGRVPFATKDAAEKWANSSTECPENSGPFNGYNVDKGWFVSCRGKIRRGPFKTENLARKAAGKLPECGGEDPSYEYPPPRKCWSTYRTSKAGRAGKTSKASKTSKV